MGNKYSKKFKKQKTEKTTTTISKISASIIVTCKDQDKDKLSILAETISKTKTDLLQNSEILLLIYGNETDNIIQSINEKSELLPLKQNNRVKLISLPEEAYEANAISSGIENVQTKYIIVFKLSHLIKASNLNQLLSISEGKIKSNSVINFIARNSKQKRTRISDLTLFPTQLGQYLFSNLSNIEIWEHEVQYKMEQLGYSIANIEVFDVTPFEDYKARGSYIARKAGKIKTWANWYIKTPLKELKSKPQTKFSFLKENSLYRFVFIVLATILFVLMPIMSIDSGISGDEPKFQYPQAKKLYNYYITLGKDKSYSESPGRFDTYGMVFDTFTIFVIDIFNIKNYYEARHILNSLMGWLAILAVGLIARYLSGWRAGIIAMLLLFISPRFIGHSWNNPKDIPFATFYILSLFYLVKYLMELPKVKSRTIFLLSLCIGLSISNRVGGLLLIPYVFLFSGLYFLFSSQRKTLLSSDNMQRFWRLMGWAVIISVLGYILCIPFWPYAIQNPIKNPLSALKFFSNYTTGLRQLFEGKIIWSNSITWNYVPKYILITVPVVVFTGILFYFMLYPLIKQRLKLLWGFLLLFVCVFPVAYMIYKKSNLYGGWRHAIFVYPSIVVIAALGYETLLRIVKKPLFQLIVALLLVGLSFHPVKHIIKNHPYQYIYFNELMGGIKNAYGKYELDYYFHSVKEATDWLLDYMKSDTIPANEPTKIRANFINPVHYYIRNAEDSIQAGYFRYYERGNHDWDYGIVTNTYINQYQLKRKIWPPKNTIHTIDVDGYPICAVIKRKNKFDYLGYEALKNNNISLGIHYLTKAIQDDPNNEIAHLNLAQVWISIKNYDAAIQTANKCLAVYPNYDRALNILGVAYMRKGDLQNALAAFNQITKVNFKYYTAYYNMAVVYARMNNIDAAIRYAQETLKYNNRYKQAYLLLAELFKKKGNNAQAEKYLQTANSL